MTSFEDAIEIDAPAERTFALVANPRYLPLIDPSATVRLLSGDWTEVGSRHLVTNRYGKALVDSTHEITRFEAPHVVEERVTMRGTVMTGSCEVRPVGIDRSVLIVRGGIEWGGSFMEFISRLASPLTGPASRRRSLARIKRVVESTALPIDGDEAHLSEEG